MTSPDLPGQSEKSPAASQPAARVFVALKVAPQIAAELAHMARVLEQLPVRVIAADDIHLTLVPPWQEPSIPAAIEKLRRVADQTVPFALAFERLCYGPHPRRPRLLWAECGAGQELATLHAALLAAFGQSEERLFRPHVTIARIRGNGAVVARIQPIDRALALAQQVETVELMQSPPPGEVGYRVLASPPLAGKPPREAAHERTSRPDGA